MTPTSNVGVTFTERIAEGGELELILHVYTLYCACIYFVCAALDFAKATLVMWTNLSTYSCFHVKTHWSYEQNCSVFLLQMS